MNWKIYRLATATALTLFTTGLLALLWDLPADQLDLSSWAAFRASDWRTQGATALTVWGYVQAVWLFGTAGDQDVPADDEGHLYLLDLYDRRS